MVDSLRLSLSRKWGAAMSDTSPALRLFEISEFGYYGLDYGDAVQRMGETLTVLVQCQYYIIAMLAVLVCALLMFIFGYAFRSRF